MIPRKLEFQYIKYISFVSSFCKKLFPMKPEHACEIYLYT